MKKYLFVLGTYYPNPSANGICVDKIIKRLESDGDSCIVLSLKDDTVNFQNDFSKTKMYFLKNTNLQNGKILNSLFFVIKRLILIPIWPIISPRLVFNYYKSIIKIIEDEKVDNVILVHKPMDTIVAGYFVKKKYNTIKFYHYYLDSFSTGTVPKHLTKNRLRKYGMKLEKFLSKSSEKTFILRSNEENYNHFIKKNSWENVYFVDIPLMDDFHHEYPKKNNKEIDVSYVGSLPTGIRDPEFTIKLLLQVKNIKINFYGDILPDNLKRIYKSEIESGVIVEHGQISHSKINQIYEKSDFLISIGAISGNFIPSKIFEYMNTGKPIINIYSQNSDISIKYMHRYKNAVSINEFSDLKESRDLINKFIINNRNKISDNHFLKKEFEENYPEHVIEKIRRDY
ncbi:hypothetical protein [Vagococcus fluvialis]|uniref:hypothetical protein n=1 Tax=Vagococcus fluvialis TaxID=2738 RepID=UPI003B5CD968